MSDDSTTRVVSDSGSDIGPGQRLREAREAAQLTSAEVASRMRLEPHIVQLLENDDYERLHGPTFVRGYLSGYARLLNLPERPILEAYERHGFGPPALVSELGGKSEVHVSDFPVRLTTYVIAGLLVVLVVMWWQSRQAPTDAPELARVADDTPAETLQPDTERTARADVSSAGTESSALVPAAAPGGQSQDPRQESEDSGGTPAASQASEPPAPRVTNAAAGEVAPQRPEAATVEASTDPGVGAAPAAPTRDTVVARETRSQTETPTDSNDAAAATGDDAMGTAPVAPGPETTDQVHDGAEQIVAIMEGDGSGDASTGVDPGAAGEEEAPPPRPEPLPGSDVLAIQLKRESWIEIYDRGGGRLYYSLAQEGSEVVVQGAGPMRVLLGDVEGAAVAYNGEPFDLSRYQGRSVVRFTVGEATGATMPTTPGPDGEEPGSGGTTEPTARRGPTMPGTESALISEASESLTPTAAREAAAPPVAPRIPAAERSQPAVVGPRRDS